MLTVAIRFFRTIAVPCKMCEIDRHRKLQTDFRQLIRHTFRFLIIQLGLDSTIRRYSIAYHHFKRCCRTAKEGIA